MLSFHCKKCNNRNQLDIQILSNLTDYIECACNNKIKIDFKEIQILASEILTAEHKIKQSRNNLKDLIEDYLCQEGHTVWNDIKIS